MHPLLRKFFRFLLTSGIGWLIDFGIFTALTQVVRLNVMPANYLSSFPAITFVFLVSTRKTFVCRKDGLTLRAKYILYVLYQLMLVSLVSLLGDWLSYRLVEFPLQLVADHAKLAAKVCITPVTMVCNFFVLRHLAEKW